MIRSLVNAGAVYVSLNLGGSMFEMEGLQRVTILYKPESLLPAMREFNDVLGMMFDGPHELRDMGMRVASSWSHGIELLAPLEHGAHSAELWRVLRERGDGVVSIAYQVKDLGSAELRARMYGRPRLGERIDLRQAHPSWWERYDVNFALPIAPVASVPVTLVQVEHAVRGRDFALSEPHKASKDLRSAGTCAAHVSF